MGNGLFYRLLSSRLAVAASATTFLLLVTSLVFRIIPLWLFLTILGVLILGVIVYALVQDRLARRRDQSLEQAMDDHTRAQIEKGKLRDKASVLEMQRKWKDGLERLRESLGRGRAALYSLPWYVIIGKPATGKTTAIKNSGLHFPLDMPKTAGTGGTRNCDWFFTEEAILLDTAGRWTEGDENPADQNEWIEFLGLLRKHRRDMPVNGLIIAVATDDLLGRDASEITSDARRMRGKLDELIRELHIQFPVYILVTKCDLVQGFTGFFKHLPKTRWTELLGWTNPGWEMENVQPMLGETFSQLAGRMADLRLALLRDEDDPEGARDVYLFPEELKGLNETLLSYCDVLFRETRYAESPFLRGVYLTSALQTGNAISRILGRLGLPPSAEQRATGSKSYFLQDFFQERLRNDDRLVVPTGSATTRWRIANNLGLAGVALTCLLAATLISASYVRNRTLLNRFEDALASVSDFCTLASNEQAKRFNGYWNDIITLRSRTYHPDFLERFGLFTGAEVLPVLERRFNDTYERCVYRPALEAAGQALEAQRTVPETVNALDTMIAYLVETREARQHDLDKGGELLAGWWNRDVARDAELRANFASAYRFYIRDPWQPPGNQRAQRAADDERAAQLARARVAIPKLLTVGRMEEWLDGFAPPVRLPSGVPGNTGAVTAAFTPKAWTERVQPLVTKVAQIEPELDGYHTARFVADYAAAYSRQWLNLLLTIREPASPRLGDLGLYCKGDSPYLAALQAVRDGVTPSFPNVPPPAWVGSLDGVLAKKDAYLSTIQSPCDAARSQVDPCVSLTRLAGSGDPLVQVRDKVRQLVAADHAQDADDAQARARMEKLLLVPVEIADRGTIDSCSAAIEGKFSRADLGLQPGVKFEDIERVLSPNFGAAWQFCKAELAPFFDCFTARPIPGSRVRIPGSVVQYYQNMRRFSPVLFDARGAWRQHSISFESLLSSEPSGGVRVTQTTLTVSCQNVDERPWTLRSRETFVRKTLRWEPDQCDEVQLRVSVGTPDGGFVEEPAPKIKSGPFGLLELLSEASREGDEYRWSFAPSGVKAGFRISVPPGLLEFYSAMHPR